MSRRSPTPAGGEASSRTALPSSKSPAERARLPSALSAYALPLRVTEAAEPSRGSLERLRAAVEVALEPGNSVPMLTST